MWHMFRKNVNMRINHDKSCEKNENIFSPRRPPTEALESGLGSFNSKTLSLPFVLINASFPLMFFSFLFWFSLSFHYEFHKTDGEPFVLFWVMKAKLLGKTFSHARSLLLPNRKKVDWGISCGSFCILITLNIPDVKGRTEEEKNLLRKTFSLSSLEMNNFV